MPVLKHKLDTLDGLDEALKPLYAKTEDGRWTLQVEDAPATNTIAKLKQDLAAAEKALKERESAEEEAKRKAAEAEALAKGDYEKLKANLEAERSKLAQERDQAIEGLKSYLLKAHITEAVAKHKGNPHLAKLVADQFEAVLDPKGEHKVLVKGDPSQTPDQFIESLKKDTSYGSFFDGSGVTGGGAPAAGAPNTSVRSRSELKTYADKSAFIEKHGLEAFQKLPE